MPAPVKTVADFFVPGGGAAGEFEPYIVGKPNGGFQLAFSTLFSTPVGDYDMRASTFGADGTVVEDQKAISTLDSSIASRQGSIDYLEDGRYVATWVDEPTAGGGDERDIKAEVFYADGSVAVAEFTVAGGVGNQQNPIVTTSPNGGFAIAYVDLNGTDNIVLKTYNQAGVLTNTVDPANIASVFSTQATTQSYDSVDMVSLENGNYVLAWTTSSEDTFAQIFSSGGTKVGSEFEVNAGAAQSFLPRLTLLSDGRFLISTMDNSTETARGTIYNEDGTVSVLNFEIAPSVDGGFFAGFADVAAFDDGRFVAVWVADDIDEIKGQMFFGDGTKDGAEFAVATVTTGTQGRPTVDVLADGRFAVAWETSESITEPSIKATIFDPRELGIAISGTRFADDLIGTAFDDNISTGKGNDKVVGGDGNDVLVGEAGDDNLSGGDGNDTLRGGNGADAMIGGDGNDLYYVDNVGDTFTELAGEGIGDYIYSSISLTIGANFERLYLEGSANINATGLDGQPDLLLGNAGNNVIDGKSGADIMRGGLGHDFYFVDDAGDTVDEVNGGGGASDFIFSSVSYTASAGIERLYLQGMDDINGTGSDGQTDLLLGNSGKNVLNGMGGADIMRGGLGDDVYHVDHAGDIVDEVNGGGGATDIIISSVSYTIAQGAERLYVTSTAPGVSYAIGRSDQADLLVGGGGSNAVLGDFGNDLLIGGGGNDFFRFNSALDGANNVDRIFDFSSVDDQFQLEDAIFTGISAGILALSAFEQGTVANDADDRIIYDSTTGAIFYDSDGNGAAAQVQFATVNVGTVLDENDFQVY